MRDRGRFSSTMFTALGQRSQYLNVQLTDGEITTVHTLKMPESHAAMVSPRQCDLKRFLMAVTCTFKFMNNCMFYQWYPNKTHSVNKI